MHSWITISVPLIFLATETYTESVTLVHIWDGEPLQITFMSLLHTMYMYILNTKSVPHQAQYKCTFRPPCARPCQQIQINYLDPNFRSYEIEKHRKKIISIARNLVFT